MNYGKDPGGVKTPELIGRGDGSGASQRVPGSVGEYQVNVLVPSGSSKGDAVPVAIRFGEAISNTATIAVQ
jgi:hypothetical protein